MNATGHIICTTSAEGGALNKIIKANGYRKFVLPDDVGGRFSVLTPVGLLPVAVAGDRHQDTVLWRVECLSAVGEESGDGA
jgi:glucose-6-phosphate isomerase